MTVLIDTNVFIWYDMNDARLSEAAAKIIEDKKNVILINAASIWEMAILMSNGDIAFYTSLDKVIKQITSRYKFKILPILNKHSVYVSTMPFPTSKHKNPFDRLIIAQSIVEDISLVASDSFFGQYKDLKLIW